MNTDMMYGGETVMSLPVSENQSFSYQSKPDYEPLPEGAVVKKISKSVYVREINNGYVKRVCTDIHYTIKEEDGDAEDRYKYDEQETYFKEKPLDILKMYI
mgnify:CR=1 FL=1